MNPKMFISYSWTSDEHQIAVLELATELRESGIDVILDKWDLQEGHDANAFMEQMISNAEIKKVALICDRGYVEKANKREGGVGVETQIITPEIYQKHDQSKFVAIVTERDDAGKPYVPIYYKSRKYIDLSDPDRRAIEFEKIVRWAYDEPLHRKPDLGPKPAYLDSTRRPLNLGTSARARRAIDAIRNARDYAIPATAEYFAVLVEEMERFRINPESDPFDDFVVESIEHFRPYRDEAVEVFWTLAAYTDSSDVQKTIHRFFESLLPYLDKPKSIQTWREWDFDNFKFIVHELYLYAIASFLNYERFDATDALMQEFYVPGESDYGRSSMAPFSYIRRYMESLDFRNKRIQARRLSLRADLLHERCNGLPVKFLALMQADFVLFLRSSIESTDRYRRWWPETLMYADRHGGAFEIFARSRSKSYFDRMKVVLGIRSKSDLDPLFIRFQQEPNDLPRWQFDRLDPVKLSGYKELESRP